MSETLIKWNDSDENLFCAYCKDRIEIGQKYGIVLEQLYSGEVIKKEFHIDCLPETPDESDEIWISPEE
jgi:hypothetical protein